MITLILQILRSFSAPITEEHAWAVIHQVHHFYAIWINILVIISDQSLMATLIRKPFFEKAVTSLGELEGLEDQLYLMTEADQLLVTKDGLVGLLCMQGQGGNVHI